MAENILVLVSDLITQNRFDEAYVILASHCEQNPQDPILEFKAGWLSYQIGRYEDAERHLKSSLSSQMANPDAHYYLGLTLLKENRPKEAMPEFRETCERKPDFAVGHLHWGICLYQSKSYKGALGQFKQAIALNPNLASAFYYAGTVSLDLGIYEDAIMYFENSLKIDPDLFNSYINLSAAYLNIDNPGKAIEILTKAAKINDKDYLLHKIWAQCLFKLGQHQESLKHFQEALNNNAKSLKAQDRALLFNDLAVNLFSLNLIEDACEKLFEAIQVDNNLIPARLNLGLAQGALGEYELSQGTLLAIEKAPSDILNYYGGINHLVMGHYEEASIMLTQITNEALPAINYFKGLSLLANENLDQALLFFNKASLDNFTNYLAYDALGCLYTMLGDYPKSIESFQLSLSLNSNFAMAHLHLAQSLLITERWDVAILEIYKAIELDPDCMENQKKLIERLINAEKYEIAFALSNMYAKIITIDFEFAIFEARILKNQEKYEEALEILNTIITAQNETGAYSVKHPASAHLLSGQIHLHLGRAAEADYMFRAAANLDDNDAQLYYSWGKTLSMLGLNEFAVEKYEKANQLDPYDPAIYEAWANALKTIGKFDVAAQVYKMASEYI